MKSFPNILGYLFKTLFFLLTVGNQSTVAQMVHTDSVEIHQSWKDKNGENKLVVNVNALCNPNKPPFDGHRTKITARLKHQKNMQEVVFEDKDYQMEMILFREKDIWFKEYAGIRAVFIPFFIVVMPTMMLKRRSSFFIITRNSFITLSFIAATKKNVS